MPRNFKGMLLAAGGAYSSMRIGGMSNVPARARLPALCAACSRVRRPKRRSLQQVFQASATLGEKSATAVGSAGQQRRDVEQAACQARPGRPAAVLPPSEAALVALRCGWRAQP